MIVLYYKKDTGQVIKTVEAPDLGVFPDPDPDQEAVMYYHTVSLPGYVSEGEFVPLPTRPNDNCEFNWAIKQWEDPRSVTDAAATALDRVDQIAGQARLRYITSVPGQAETYAKKEQQARAWASAAFWGAAPSFIAAEAAALGVSAQSVAEEVISLADFWANVKGPQIEATRRKWKVSIESAATVLQVDQMVESAKAELEAL